MIVENKPGAGGVLGIEQGVKSAPDGYTLTLIASSYTVNPSVYKLKFDPVDDITPIIQISQGPLLLVVRPSLPVKTTQELIALAKAKPGQINFASSGQGSVIHMATELFDSMAGIKMNHIPYKGTGPALTDTIGGQTDVFFSSTATALPHVQVGQAARHRGDHGEAHPGAAECSDRRRVGRQGLRRPPVARSDRAQGPAAPDRRYASTPR